MKEIIDRCNFLIKKAKNFSIKSTSYYFSDDLTQEVQKWISSSVNIISIVVPASSYFNKECERIISDEHYKDSIPTHIVKRLSGLLEALCDEIESGFFKQLEYILTASTFDDFLDHAEHFHKGGKKMESAVLSSIVFEDTIRKIAKKNEVEESGNDLETIINDLTNVNIFTQVKAKRYKSNAAIRNKALHAQWEEFDLKDIGMLIKCGRELIEDYL
ncbi:hypothetical protein [Aliarcobacter butzleri]|uniref:hypothetical protein n=1 Tax=Aliarcobacter butzleri TaxID=28197 RepID=UPI00263F3EDA|nr:hypothetical protein [Aliarcobacter butzleri]MDN5088017.1 hypothetical protein [Aliarcobacter butzleri]